MSNNQWCKQKGNALSPLLPCLWGLLGFNEDLREALSVIPSCRKWSLSLQSPACVKSRWNPELKNNVVLHVGSPVLEMPFLQRRSSRHLHVATCVVLHSTQLIQIFPICPSLPCTSFLVLSWFINTTFCRALHWCSPLLHWSWPAEPCRFRRGCQFNVS